MNETPCHWPHPITGRVMRSSACQHDEPAMAREDPIETPLESCAGELAECRSQLVALRSRAAQTDDALPLKWGHAAKVADSSVSAFQHGVAAGLRQAAREYRAHVKDVTP